MIKADLKTASTDTDERLKKVEAATGETIKKSLTKLEESLEDQIAELRGEVFCSFKGELKCDDDGKKCECECVDKYEGDRCQTFVPPNCKGQRSKTGVVEIDGAKVFCHAVNGGGWELGLNLATRLKPTLWFDSEWWGNEKDLGKIDKGLTTDFKGDCFHKKKDMKEIMVMAHDNGKVAGWGSYEILKGKQGKTLHELFKGGWDQTITGSRKKKGGGVKGELAHNPHREQKLYGDIFVDNFDAPLVFNAGEVSKSSWNACKNWKIV